jgi:hydroxyquinol 1,2-dioxygenase
MRDLNQNTITREVIDRFKDTPDPRLKALMTSLVTHLHDFARETHLTEPEWERAIAFLTATGQKCDDKRQEFILLSDVLGLSMLLVAMNHDKPASCTEATVFGPFHVEDAPQYALGDDVANGAEGPRMHVHGVVRGLDGEAVPHAVMDIWQADSKGFYDVQHELPESQGRGVIHSDAEGRYHFRSIVAAAYPIPVDGPVGQLLDATHRHPWRPAHLHFRIRAPGYESLTTHVFRDGDRWLDSDSVFGVRQSLVKAWTPSSDGGLELEYDFILAPNVATKRARADEFVGTPRTTSDVASTAA